MVQFTARGLVPPVFTPLNEDCSLNVAAIPPYLEYLVKNGIKSVLVNGTTGEGPNFTVDERKLLTSSWVAAARPHGVHVMVQVGGAPLPDVLALARYAESEKVDSILTLPELYFKPQTVEDLVAFVEQVAAAAPATPVLYYHIPAMSGVNLNMAQFIREATRRVPNFKGIKYTSNDLSDGSEALAAVTGDQAVFLGADSLWAPAQLQGFDSAIGTTFNILPRLASDISAAVASNDVGRARALQQRLNQFVAILTPEGTWVPVMKVAMEVISGLRMGPPRFPLKRLSAQQVDRIKIAFQKQGFL